MVPRHPGRPLTHPGPLLVRRLRAVRGTVVFTITYRPAFDFGRQDHAVHAPGHGGAVFNSPGAQAGLVLGASQRFAVAGHATTAAVTLGPGRVARSAGLVEVVEEKLDSRGGVAAKDLLH